MAVSVPVPIDQRFAQLIKQFGLTKNSFAVSLGKTASVVQHLIDGRNKPGYDLLCKVFEIYPNVSRDWLLLGRGPMLVSGDHAPRPAVPVASVVPELPLEPIDLSDVALSQRRAGPGVAGTRLQPVEIAATLALAAAATHPARTTASAANETAPTAAAAPVVGVVPAPAVAETVAVPEMPTLHYPTPGAAAPVAPAIPALSALPSPAAPAGPTPEIYVAAALHAQHLQHQLALAELRNQHLLDQQQMLREMLAMARQSA